MEDVLVPYRGYALQWGQEIKGIGKIHWGIDVRGLDGLLDDGIYDAVRQDLSLGKVESFSRNDAGILLQGMIRQDIFGKGHLGFSFMEKTVRSESGNLEEICVDKVYWIRDID